MRMALHPAQARNIPIPRAKDGEELSLPSAWRAIRCTRSRVLQKEDQIKSGERRIESLHYNFFVINSCCPDSLAFREFSTARWAASGIDEDAGSLINEAKGNNNDCAWGTHSNAKWSAIPAKPCGFPTPLDSRRALPRNMA